ncbi:hypothetical protein [Inquilinus limosus]|uniref:Uncharacterized protein n=1 Tax=Inquilinus limosus TaxID=171674 RepID=A0A211ZQ43_9PROT|nr:hypothetical protein [Inquilinus limosus]OWJ67385.1 hypothetical protein BWR60_09265 [Inquilinus limosus]
MIAFALTAGPAFAAGHGTEGLTERAFQAENRGDGRIACDAAIAHWYSVDLGQAGPGASVSARLWFDPAGGAVYLLNDKQDRLPVETLWCGEAGRSWATRSVIDLPRHAGPVATMAITVGCAPAGDRLVCR